MTSASMKAKIVHIQVEADKSGLLFATSADLKGLLVAERTREELEAAIPAAITALYAACGTAVVVTMLEDGDDEYAPWVAVPVPPALARAVLDQQRA
jgi:hypothetical protein